jgi:LPS O-antigen subunit length determinant protein (WzzB/FepE family)
MNNNPDPNSNQNPQSTQKNFKQLVENNLIIFFIGTFGVAFGLGYNTYKQLITDSLLTLKDSQDQVQRLKGENKDLRNSRNNGIRIFYNNKNVKKEIENFIEYLKDDSPLNKPTSLLVTEPPHYDPQYNDCVSKIKYFNREDSEWALRFQNLSREYFKDRSKFKANFNSNFYQIEQAPFSIEIWIASCK